MSAIVMEFSENSFAGVAEFLVVSAAAAGALLATYCGIRLAIVIRERRRRTRAHPHAH